MKTNYQKPENEVTNIEQATMLATSMQGGEIGGETDRFDAPRPNAANSSESSQEKWDW